MLDWLSRFHAGTNSRVRRRNRIPAFSGNGVLCSLVDALEDRMLLTAVSMSDREQLLLELINRARLNPSGEATRFGVPLNAGLPAGTISTAPKQPLAPHQSLVNAASLHSQDMLNKDYFSHTNKEGLQPEDRAVNAGYPTTSVGENIATSGTTGSLNENAAVYASHQDLFESPGHRENMLSPNYEEIGTGIRYGVFTDGGTNFNSIMVTEKFGTRGINPVITGVVYADSDDDNFYSIGEAIRSGTITASETTSGQIYADDIGVSGCYRVIVPAGTYSVVCRFEIGGTQYVSTRTVTVGSVNVKVDFEAADAIASILSVSVSSGSMSESGGQTSVTLTVTRGGPTAAPLVVSLSSSDATEATLPNSVTILSGQTSAQVTVASVNDGLIDGNQLTTLTASATGSGGVTAKVTTIDTTAPNFSTAVVETNSVRPTISWNTLSNATRYEIWADNVATGQSKVISDANVASNSFTPSFDLPLGVYSIWIRGFSSGGRASLWSLPQTLRVRTPPTVSAAMTTVNAADFTFVWNALAGAAGYDVWIDRLTSSTSQYYRNTSVGQASISLTGFALGRYGVWVRGLTARGDIGNWSQRGNITVNLAPAPPDVTAASFSGATTVSWPAVDGAAAYEVWVNNRTTGASAVVRQSGIATTSFQLPAIPAASYAVWVRAYDSQGTAYSWSSECEFDIQRPPRILTPSGTNNTGTPLISWTKVAGAARYELWVSSLNGAGRVVNETSLTATSYAPPSAFASGSYRIWVRAVDTTNATTAWSEFRDFSVASTNQRGRRLPKSSGRVAPLERIVLSPMPEIDASLSDAWFSDAETISWILQLPTSTAAERTQSSQQVDPGVGDSQNLDLAVG